MIGQIVYSPDSSKVAVSSSTGIRIHDARTLEQLAEFANEDWVASLAYSPDGKTIAAWLPDGSVALWDTTSYKLVKTLSAPTEGGAIRVTADEMHNVTFSPNGETLAHRANMAITFGKYQLERGHPLTIFLNDKGVFVGSKAHAAKYAEHQKVLGELMGKGAAVIACPMCMKHYGVETADLMPGIQVGKPELTGAALFKDGTKTMSW